MAYSDPISARRWRIGKRHAGCGGRPIRRGKLHHNLIRVACGARGCGSEDAPRRGKGPLRAAAQWAQINGACIGLVEATAKEADAFACRRSGLPDECDNLSWIGCAGSHAVGDLPGKLEQLRFRLGSRWDLRRIHSNGGGYVVKKTKPGAYDWLFVLNERGEQFLIKRCLHARRSWTTTRSALIAEPVMNRSSRSK